MYVFTSLHPTQSGSGEDVNSVRSEAVRDVVEFNKKLALQRKQYHSSFYDRQTQVPQPVTMLACNVWTRTVYSIHSTCIQVLYMCTLYIYILHVLYSLYTHGLLKWNVANNGILRRSYCCMHI